MPADSARLLVALAVVIRLQGDMLELHLVT